MSLRNVFVFGLTALSAVSAAVALPATTYVSGILHEAVGDAALGAESGRVLQISNLGSSGEDGVEVRCRSAWGGGVAVDLSQFAGVGTTNREIKIRPKGWDGTIKGTMRAYNSLSTGETMLAADFSAMGATDCDYVEYDSLGNIVDAGTLPVDGLALGPCPNQYQIWYVSLHLISLGPPKQYTITWHYYCSNCPDPWQWFDPCGGPSTQRIIVVTPNLPGGTPGLGDLDSLLVTGRDLPDLTGDGVPDLIVGNADVKSFSTPCPPWDCLGPSVALDNARWGLGQAHISEECTPDNMGGCDESDRRLVVTNIGSSGQDGVAINLPESNGGFSATLAKGNCCRGHVIIMKAFDDEGQEQRISLTQTMDPAGTEELDVDFSALGANGYRLTAYDGGGVVIGPPGGTAIIGGGPKTIITNPCPPGSKAIYDNYGTAANPIWVIVGCLGVPMDLVVPGTGTLTGVASFAIEPLNATLPAGRLVRCEILSDDPEGLIIEDFSVTPAPAVCAGDANCDGIVNWRDIDFFVGAMNDNMAAWEALFAPGTPACTFANNDANSDGTVNWRDIDPFVGLINTTCP